VGSSCITLRLPKGCPLPTVHGRWERLDTGEIEAEYMEEELRVCLGIVGALGGTSTAGKTTRGEQLSMAGVVRSSFVGR